MASGIVCNVVKTSHLPTVFLPALLGSQTGDLPQMRLTAMGVNDDDQILLCARDVVQ
jgi:hypothetical protein